MLFGKTNALHSHDQELLLLSYKQVFRINNRYLEREGSSSETIRIGAANAVVERGKASKGQAEV